MSTYVPGITDNIIAEAPFDPNLGYYANVLSTKQSQYDQGLAQVNGLYASAFNQPLTREDTSKRRDAYLKNIENQIRDVAAKDLSIDQNVNIAKSLFKPILNDKHIVNDMIYTKRISNAFQESEYYRNCKNPDTCGGEYSEKSVRALRYAQEEFKNASPEDALRFEAPSYVPGQNIAKLTVKALKEAKDAGFFNSTVESIQGGYRVTDSGGNLVYGPVSQYLFGLFGTDDRIQKMYTTNAYVDRKDAARAYAMEHGNTPEAEVAGEMLYMKDTLHKAELQATEAKKANDKIRNIASTNMAVIENAVKTSPPLKGDGTEDKYAALVDVMNRTQAAVDHHQNVANLIETAPNLNDRRAMQNRVDNIVANAHFMSTIDDAAKTYALSTMKHELKADEYSLSAYNHKLALQNSMTMAEVNFDIFKRQEVFKKGLENAGLFGAIANDLGIDPSKSSGNLGSQVQQVLKEKGLGDKELLDIGVPTDSKYWTADDIKKIRASGALQSEAGSLMSFSNMVSKNLVENAYTAQNDKIMAAAGDFMGSAGNLLKITLDSYKRQFVGTPDTKEGTNPIKDKIKNNLRIAFEGNPSVVDQFLSGKLDPEDIARNPNLYQHAAQKLATLMKDDISTGFITDPTSTQALMKYELAGQVHAGLDVRRQKEAAEIKKQMSADLIANSYESGANASINGVGSFISGFGSKRGLLGVAGMPDISNYLSGDTKSESLPTKLQFGLIDALVTKRGLNTDNAAKNEFVRKNVNAFTTDESSILLQHLESPSNMKSLPKDFSRLSPTQRAERYFDLQASAVRDQYLAKVSSWDTPSGETNVGGMKSPKKEMKFTFEGDKPGAPQTIQLKEIAKTLPTITNAVYGNANQTDLPESNDKDVQGKAQTFFDAVATGNIGNDSFNYTARKVGDKILAQVYLPADVAKKVYGLSGSDSVLPYQSFSVQIPTRNEEGVPINAPIIQKMMGHFTYTPAELYMLRDGAMIKQNIPGFSEYHIVREGGDLVLHATVKEVNPMDGGSSKDATISVNLSQEGRSRNWGEISIDDALPLANEMFIQKRDQYLADKHNVTNGNSSN